MIAEDTYLITVETASGERDMITFYIKIPHQYYDDEEFLTLLTREVQDLLMRDEHAQKHHHNYKIVSMVNITQTKPVKEN